MQWQLEMVIRVQLTMHNTSLSVGVVVQPFEDRLSWLLDEVS